MRERGREGEGRRERGREGEEGRERKVGREGRERGREGGSEGEGKGEEGREGGGGREINSKIQDRYLRIQRNTVI